MRWAMILAVLLLLVAPAAAGGNATATFEATDGGCSLRADGVWLWADYWSFDIRLSGDRCDGVHNDCILVGDPTTGFDSEDAYRCTATEPFALGGAGQEIPTGVHRYGVDVEYGVFAAAGTLTVAG